jgi:hypothetical protein
MPETTNDIQEALQDAILKNLSSPKNIQSEAGSVEQHSLTDLIAVDKYLRQKQASQKPATMRLIKVIKD